MGAVGGARRRWRHGDPAPERAGARRRATLPRCPRCLSLFGLAEGDDVQPVRDAALLGDGGADVNVFRAMPVIVQHRLAVIYAVLPFGNHRPGLAFGAVVQAWVAALDGDRRTPLLLICRSGERALRAAGWAEDAPIVVVQKASWPGEEKIVRGTLADIKRRCQDEKIGSQAMIIASPLRNRMARSKTLVCISFFLTEGNAVTVEVVVSFMVNLLFLKFEIFSKYE